MNEQTLIFDKETAALLVQDAADLVIKQFVVDHKIRLDDAQMEILGQAAAKHIGIDIDYPAIAENVIKHITGLKNSTDLFLTEAVRGDFFEKLREEIVEKIVIPKDGLDGKHGLNGQDGSPGLKGENYILTGNDQEQIAGMVKQLIPAPKRENYKITKKIRADIAEDTLSQFLNNEKILELIVEGVLASERIISRESVIAKLKALRKVIDRPKVITKSGINAGISGGDMIGEINKTLGQSTWQGGGGGATGFSKGEADGFVVKRSSTTAAAITAGQYEANGKDYTLSADTTHTMTNIVSAFGRHYVYIDDSASVAPTPTFIDSTTEPIFDDVRRGWYNGDDRFIGFIYSAAGVTTILPTSVRGSGKLISIHFNRIATAEFILALNLNPSGVWQATTLKAADALPVNAVRVSLQMSGSDSAFTVRVAAASVEFSVLETSISTGDIIRISNNNMLVQGWVNLGVSRNIVIGGENDDDNALICTIDGTEYSR